MKNSRLLFSAYLIYLQLLSIKSSIVKQPPAESKLQSDLLKLYDWPVRPVRNHTNRLDVFMHYKLFRVVEVNLRDETIELQIQIDQEWINYKFIWNPKGYDGITETYLPTDKVWVPDLTLRRSAGPLELMGDTVQVFNNGLAQYRAISMVKGFCPIDLKSYPFDIQTCNLTFASWTYGGYELWITLKNLPPKQESIRMDLSKYQMSLEWDLISIPGYLFERYYTEINLAEPYPEIHFVITLRRHSQFYLLNLVMPLIGLSYLSVMVFYLPANSGEKITLCVSLMTSQVTFLLLMIDNIPVTSVSVPLLGKVIIFNLVLNFCSIVCTIFVLNIYFRKSSVYNLPKWMNKLSNCKWILTFLMIGTPVTGNKDSNPKVFPAHMEEMDANAKPLQDCVEKPNGKSSDSIKRTMKNISYIRNRLAYQIHKEKECESWKYIAALVDRIFFILFHIAFFVCTSLILYDAQALYDQKKAINSNFI